MRIFLLTLSFFLFLSGGQLGAQMMIEEADPVPAGIAAEQIAELQKEKESLDSEYQEISSDLQEYNALCLGANAGAGCQGRYYGLTGRMSTYQATLIRYRSAIKKAEGK